MVKTGNISYPIERTIFHELGHITDENKREGVKSREMLQIPMLGEFYEWTNTVFERLVIGKKFYKKNDAMQLSSSGYEALAPLGSMVCCALGIPEIEFAKIKDKGKEAEVELLEHLFPNLETDGGIQVLEKVKDIFNKYFLDTSFSLTKKRSNQTLLNELYSECLELINTRIENQLKSDSIVNIEEYKKHQMFYLKKMNYNFKIASKTDGFRFLRSPIIHDINFCNDKISKHDLMQIAQEHILMTEFGFDNNSLGKYNRTIMLSSDKENFQRQLKVSKLQLLTAKDDNKNAIIKSDSELEIDEGTEK